MSRRAEVNATRDVVATCVVAAVGDMLLQHDIGTDKLRLDCHLVSILVTEM